MRYLLILILSCAFGLLANSQTNQTHYGGGDNVNGDKVNGDKIVNNYVIGDTTHKRPGSTSNDYQPTASAGQPCNKNDWGSVCFENKTGTELHFFIQQGASCSMLLNDRTQLEFGLDESQCAYMLRSGIYCYSGWSNKTGKQVRGQILIEQCQTKQQALR